MPISGAFTLYLQTFFQIYDLLLYDIKYKLGEGLFMKKLVSIILAAAALLYCTVCLTGCLPSSYSQYRKGPAMWVVEDGDGHRCYLFGSQHVNASADVFPFADVIEDAFSYCDSIAVEYDIIAEEKRQQAFTEEELSEYEAQYTYADGTTVSDHISEAVYRRAVARIDQTIKLGGNADGYTGEYDKFMPAIWYSVLESISTYEAGYSTEYGVDRYFINKAYETGKTVLEVESDAAQLSMLLEIDDCVYEYMMKSLLDNPSGLAYMDLIYQSGEMSTLSRAIAAGRAEKYSDAALDAGMREYDELMYVKRNALMADAVMKYLAEGRRTFFVVGCAHMLCDDGIVSILLNNGYKVYRK